MSGICTCGGMGALISTGAAEVEGGIDAAMRLMCLVCRLRRGCTFERQTHLVLQTQTVRVRLLGGRR